MKIITTILGLLCVFLGVGAIYFQQWGEATQYFSLAILLFRGEK